MKSIEAVRMRLKHLMKEYKTNYNDLSMKSGLPRSTIKTFFYYKNARSVTIYTLSMLCGGLGITLTDFFNDDIFKYVDDLDA